MHPVFRLLSALAVLAIVPRVATADPAAVQVPKVG